MKDNTTKTEQNKRHKTKQNKKIEQNKKHKTKQRKKAK